MVFKVVVTDYEFDSMQIEHEVLQQAGAELILTQCHTEEEVVAAARDADGIINQYAPLSRRVIENLENCKVIARYGVGVNTIDLDAATEKGIIVSNVTDYCLDEVADHAFALLMACARKTVRLNEQVKAGNWDFKVSVPIFRLRNKVLGLVGFGNIPRNLAQKAQAFGLRVIAYDPYVSPDIADNAHIRLVTLEELCQQADFISVHAPLTNSTKGLISDNQFNLMKKEAFIINTARGPLIDEKALIHALETGKIAGAGLDVTETEPISPDNPLLKLEPVILNPHAAWYSEESEAELKRKTAQNIADVLQGFYPAYLVNQKVKESIQLNMKEETTWSK
ncbi:C-terminal binding protein [Terribacillus saccharophilus]|uniref:C-terminal binding protein n=1 Tax=Terribacillus saccharophilus TaxID=361277 RepID=UPI003981CED0